MGKKPIIRIIDSVHCRANSEARKIILPFLRYKKKYFKNSFFKKEVSYKDCFLITGRNNSSGLFYTGLLPRIKNELKKINKEVKIIGKIEKIKSKKTIPNLKGITFRKDQLKAIRRVRKYQRGKIISPTGSGKTIIALGIMSIFPDLRFLFLCHTIDLLVQTQEELEKFNFKYFIIGNNNKVNWDEIKNLDSVILLSTIQSFTNLKKENWSSFFDATIIDEGHHVVNEKSQYGQLMQQNLAPIKICFTATEPIKEQEILINEGLFGPKIAELTIEDGIKNKILAKPKVKLFAVPYNAEITTKSNNKYHNFYLYGIVKNKERNKIIVRETIENLKQKQSTLIIVENIFHGDILVKLFRRKKIYVSFVQGKMDRDVRRKIKNKMKKEERKITICTKVWREGVNIPSLNNIINAAGMKDEKIILQLAGRGLRITKKKKEIVLIDFLDPYRYLAEHSIMRYSIYQKNGWLQDEKSI